MHSEAQVFVGAVDKISWAQSLRRGFWSVEHNLQYVHIEQDIGLIAQIAQASSKWIELLHGRPEDILDFSAWRVAWMIFQVQVQHWVIAAWSGVVSIEGSRGSCTLGGAAVVLA